MVDTSGSSKTQAQARPRDSKTGGSGRAVVLTMVALGLIGGALALWYWLGVDGRTWPGDDAANGSNASAPSAEQAFDRDAADAELERISEEFRQVAGTTSRRVRPALVAARTFVSRYPHYAPAHTHEALVLIELGRYDDARQALARSLRIDDRSAQAHALLGDIARALGHIDQAEQHYQQAIERDPDNLSRRVKLAHIDLARDDLDAAMAKLSAILEADSSVHEAHIAVSDIQTRRGDFREAVEAADRALANVPMRERRDRVIYTRRKAALMRMQDRPDDALLVLDTLRADDKLLLPVMEEMAECYALLGRPERSAGVYEDAMTADPLEPRYAIEAAAWRIEADDLRQADRHLRAARQLDPDAPRLSQLQAQLNAETILE